MPGMLRDVIIIIRHLKKNNPKDPSIFPYPKGQVPGERELLSSFKSHHFGLVKHCGVILLLLLLIFFKKAPTDPFLPYPVKVSQVCTDPDRTLDRPSPGLWFKLQPIPAKFRDSQFPPAQRCGER